MKRTLFVFVGLFIAGFLLFSAIPLVRRTIQSPSVPVVAKFSVSLSIDFGDRKTTVSEISAATAFDALMAGAAKEQIEIKRKQYDFGVFVEEIGGVANTKEKSWIYFLNGKSGTVAADKQSVAAGDTVEWRYIEPTIE